MIRKILLILALFLSLQAPVHAEEPCKVDEDDLFSLMFNGVQLWRPSAFQNASFKDPCDHDIVTKPVTTVDQIARIMAKAGFALLICFIIMESARRILTGGGLHPSEAVRLYASAIIIGSLLASAFVGGNEGTPYTKIVGSIVITPVERIVGAVMNTGTEAVVSRFATAYANYARASQGDGWLSSYIPLLNLSIPLFITCIFLVLALIICWVVSLYVSIMCSVMIALGPLFLPFIVFKPLSQVGWNWVRSMIAFPMMCVVGSVATSLLMSSSMLTFSVEAAEGAQYMTAIASSSMLILVMIMVPSITNSLVGGVQASPMGAARTLGAAANQLGQMAKPILKRAGAAAGGAAMFGGGAAAKGASKGSSGAASAMGAAATATASAAARMGASATSAMETGGASMMKGAALATASGVGIAASRGLEAGAGFIKSAGSKLDGPASATMRHGMRTMLNQVPGVQAYRSFKSGFQGAYTQAKSSGASASDFSGSPGAWESKAASQSAQSQNDSMASFAYFAYGRETSSALRQAFSTGQATSGYGKIPQGMHQSDFLKATVDQRLAQAGIKPSNDYYHTDGYNSLQSIRSDSFTPNGVKDDLTNMYHSMQQAGATPDQIAYSIRAEAVQRTGNELAMMNHRSFMSSSPETKRAYIQHVAAKYQRPYNTADLPKSFIAYPVKGQTYEQSVIAAMDNYFKKTA